MNIKLTNPIAFLDVESTGVDPCKDRIVTLAIVQIHPDAWPAPSRPAVEWKFNPGVEMTPENIAIHGITNESVKDCPTFDRHARDIHAALTGCDLAGFNLRNFDIPIIFEELDRCGIEWDLTGVNIVDAFTLFRKKEPRDLSAAVEFYCGREHTGAHSAMADTLATLDVFNAQTDGRHRYGDLAAMDIPALAKFCNVERDGSERIDLAGTIIRNKEGVPVFGTKRNRGVPIASDLSYARWILRSEFPTETRMVLQKIVNQIIDQQETGGQGGLF